MNANNTQNLQNLFKTERITTVTKVAGNNVIKKFKEVSNRMGIDWTEYSTSPVNAWIYKVYNEYFKTAKSPISIVTTYDGYNYCCFFVTRHDDAFLIFRTISDDEIEINNYSVKLVVKKIFNYHIREQTEPQMAWFSDALGIPDVNAAVDKLGESGLTDSIKRLAEAFGNAIENPSTSVEGVVGTIKETFSGTSSQLQNNVLIILGITALIVSLRDNRKTLMSVSAGLIAYAYRQDIAKALSSLEMMEKIKKLFGKKQREETEMDTIVPQSFFTDSATEIASLISMIIIGTDAFKGDSKSAINLLRDFGTAKSGIQSVVSSILKIIEFIIVKSGAQNSLDKLYFLINDGKVKYDEFAQKVFDLDDLVQQKKLPNTLTSYERVVELLKQGQTLLKDVPRHASTPGLISTLSNCVNRLQKYSQAIASSGLLSQGLRQEPVCVFLRGGPGVFKSQTAQHLATALISLVISDEERESFTKNPSAYYYNRTIEQQYWDGYDSNKIVTLFDDAFQQRDCVGGGDSEAMNIIRAINENAYDLHMANLNDKGSTKFRSSFVILTSNAAKPESQQILDRKALLRRFHCSYTVVPKKQYEHNKSGNSVMDKRIDIEKLPKGALGVSSTDPSISLDFHEHDMLTDKPTGNVYSFSEVVTKAHQRYLQHLKYYEQKIKELDDRRDEYFHLKDEVFPQMNSIFTRRSVSPSGIDPEYYTDANDRFVYSDSIEGADSYINELCSIKTDLSEHILESYQRMNVREKFNFYFRIVAIIKHFGPQFIGVEENFISNVLFGTYYSGINTILEENMSDKQCIHILSKDSEFCQRWVKKSTFKYYFGNGKNVKELMSDALSSISQFMSKCKNYLSFITWKKALAIATGLSAIIGIAAYFFLDKNGDENLQTEGDYKMKPKKKMAQRRKASEIRNLRTVPQLSLVNDPQGEDINKKVVRKNMYTFHVRLNEDAEWIKSGFVTFVKGNVAIVPHHFFDLISEYEIDNPEDKIYVRLTGPKNEQGKSHVVNYSASELYSCVYDTPTLLGQDLCLIGFPNFPPRPDITKFFMNSNDLQNLNSKPKCILSNFQDELLTVHLQGKVMKEIFVSTKEIGDYSINTTIAYDASTRKGDCGSILTVLDPSKSTRKVAGFHVAGSPKSNVGYSALVSIEEIEECMAEIPENMLIVCQMRDIGNEPEKTIGDGRFGYIARAKKAHLAVKTAIIKSPLASAALPSDNMPAKLKPEMVNNELVSPWTQAMVNYNMETPVFNVDEVTIASEQYRDYIFANSTKPIKNEIYTFDQAVAGIPCSEFDSINRRTSPGYPDVIEITKGMKGKTFYFGNDDEFDLFGTNATELRNRCQKVIDDAANNIRNEHIFMDSLKDELRPIPKAMDFKTRLISASPIVLLITYRMYFGAFMHWYKVNRIDNQSAIGVNVYSEEWDLIAKKLSTFSPVGSHNIGAGDYSKFDGSEKPLIHNEILNIIQQWYKGTPEEERIRRVLWLELTNSLHIQEDVLYEWYTSLPSGHPLTATVNTMYNGIAFRYCWLRAFDSEPEYKYTFNKNAYLICLGDDNVFSVHPNCSNKFTEVVVGHYMSELGLTYTSETKDVVNETLRALTEVEFLKRRWRYSTELRRYVAPHQIKKLRDMPLWTKRGSQADQIVIDKVDSVISELALHGKHVFAEQSKYICDLSVETMNHYPQDLNYSSNLQKISSMEMFC